MKRLEEEQLRQELIEGYQVQKVEDTSINSEWERATLEDRNEPDSQMAKNIELKAKCSDLEYAGSESTQELRLLRERFNIADDDLIEGSYSDLIAEARNKNKSGEKTW